MIWQLIVDSGRFARETTAPVHTGAAVVGETDQKFNQAANVEPRSNSETLLAAIREFFRENPVAEVTRLEPPGSFSPR